MNRSKGLQAAISLVDSGKRYPVMKLVNDSPELAALISKMVVAPTPAQYDSKGNRSQEMPNVNELQNRSNTIARNINDAETVMQLLPDMELSAQILVSSIISPKDMTSTELTFTAPEGLLDAETANALITSLRTHFRTVYKIEPLLPKILRDVLFDTGSYAVAAIPESAIDDVINGSDRITMETLKEFVNADGTLKPLGLLGTPTASETTRKSGIAVESLKEYKFDSSTYSSALDLKEVFGTPHETFISVCDNPAVLKVPHINERIRETRVLDSLGMRALEAGAVIRDKRSGQDVKAMKLTDRAISQLIYKNREYGYKPISALKTQDQLKRRTVGEPLIMKFPSEAVIPVHVPANPEKHIGYFILLDMDGNPLCKTNNQDFYQELGARLQSNGSFPSAMLDKVKNGINGFDCGNRSHLDYSTRVFGTMVEADLLARLRNGVYGNGVALAKNEEVYRIMLSRAFAKQHTQLLFVPIELMTYFAFRYNADGVGQSLLDGMKILNSLRAMLMFADTMAAVKNSIGRTEVKLKLDEDDPDPKKTVETAIHEIIRSRQQYFPLGANSPTDLVNYLQKAAYEFTFEGHPGLPDLNIEFNERNSNYQKPDQELAENLRKSSIMSVGLSPEQVDSGFQAEFATTVVSNNILLSKRVMQIQEIFTPQLADHLRKVAFASESLIESLLQIIRDNFDKIEFDFPDEEEAKELINTEYGKEALVQQILRAFLTGFEVGLPTPNTITLENQMEALETYTKALDAALDAYISDSWYTTDLGGEVANEVRTARELVKAYYIRKWLADNSVLPELSELVTMGEDGKPMLDMYEVQSSHVNALTKSLANLLKKVQPVKDATDKELEESGAALDGGGGDTSGSDDSGGGGGDDDFDMSGDFDLNENPDEPSEPESEPEEEKETEEEPSQEPEPDADKEE